VAADGSEGFVVVETPLQHIRIALAGGVVSELELENFRVYGSKQRVELVPEVYATEPGRGGLAMTVRAGGDDWDLARGAFHGATEVASGAPLVLGPGSGPRTFDLRCEATGGGALVKSITIDPDPLRLRGRGTARARAGVAESRRLHDRLAGRRAAHRSEPQGRRSTFQGGGRGRPTARPQAPR
jgi:hypothetical protein